MKTKKTRILSIVLALVVCLTLSCVLCACNEADVNETTDATTEVVTEAVDPLWENATYLEDVTLGEGATTIEVEVEANDKAITVTINTDAENLEEALLEAQLVEGEDGDYGLYIKTVNGILADYEADQSYWAIYENGEYMTSGVNTTEIATGDHYELVYTK